MKVEIELDEITAAVWRFRAAILKTYTEDLMTETLTASAVRCVLECAKDTNTPPGQFLAVMHNKKYGLFITPEEFSDWLKKAEV